MSNESVQIFPTQQAAGYAEELRNNVSEAQVWLEFLHGSDLALGTIYRAYANKLYAYGKQFTKNESLVLDAVQDVFLTLIKNREKLGVAVSVKFYLFASFRRRLLRQLRRNKLFVFNDDLSDGENFNIAVNAAHLSVNTQLDEYQKKIIEDSCNKLPAKQREAIMLHYFEELSYKEIATIMQLSHIKSARNIIYKALDSLARILSSHRKELS